MTVGLSVEEFVQIAPCLDREIFELDRFPSLRGAMDLVTCQRIDVLLVRYCQPETDLAPFLQAVRNRTSPCRRSPLLLLTTYGADMIRAKSFVGRGANRALALNCGCEALQSAIFDLLRVAPRKPCRVIAQLEIKQGSQKDWVLCRTRNGSKSGILLETNRQIPTGTRVDFELTLPTAEKPIVGRAEVTRQTQAGRESIHGVGMRFLSFAGDSRRSYEAFLSRPVS